MRNSKKFGKISNQCWQSFFQICTIHCNLCIKTAFFLLKQFFKMQGMPLSKDFYALAWRFFATLPLLREVSRQPPWAIVSFNSTDSMDKD